MRRRPIALAAGLTLLCSATIAAQQAAKLLPTGWRLTPPPASVATTGTMPQGLALSPDGRALAVVESGTNPPALRLLDVPSLTTRTVIPLQGAFGAPVWRDATHVLVAGANAGAVLNVDVTSGSVAREDVSSATAWPAAVAVSRDGLLATANDGDGTVTLDGRSVAVGGHPAALAFSPDGTTLYVSVRQTNRVAVIDARGGAVSGSIPVGRHPEALALTPDGRTLYVAESDDDSVGVIDTVSRRRTGSIDVGLHEPWMRGPGASPNALLLHGNDLFVSLGAENAVAVIRGGKVSERIPAGWYPTGVAAAAAGTLYVTDGYGEGDHPNPQFDPLRRDSPGYVAAITVGSVREIPQSVWSRAAYETSLVVGDARPQWRAPEETIVRSGGPIRHVIYIIKENRTYDQILGDLPGANGEATLAMFGGKTTPNQHALAERFGIFDNAYTDAQVSAPGHNWTDAAFSNDFVERRWPPNYGGRLKTYDFQDGEAPDVPHNGYLWDAAERAHLTYRDYGEDIDFPGHGVHVGVNTFAGLTGHFDPTFVGWDLRTSDMDRYDHWQQEFDAYVAHDDLPQLEIVYFPNDHTSGTAPGAPTPFAYIALNDYAVGKLVDHVSHSKYWNSTVIIALEDDAQNGPDHVSDQRSTFYIASPYAKGGVQHGRYSTSSFVRTIELFLGLPPLSAYDSTARPLYDAFALHPVNARPFNAIAPEIDVNAKNSSTAYGAAISARMDWSHADAANAAELNDILEHVRR